MRERKARKTGGLYFLGASSPKPRRETPNPKHLFAFEALEPRLLLSGELNPAAGLAIIDGLQALDSVANGLGSSTALASNVAYINRTLGDLAALGDPIASVQSAASAYLTNNASATIGGLATALGQIPSAKDTVTSSVSGNLETVTLNLTVSDDAAATPIDLSASAGGHTLTTTQSLTQTTTRALNLVFGVDVTNATAPAFELQSATITSNNTLAGSNFSGAATVDGTSQAVADGSAEIAEDVSASFHATAAKPLTTAVMNSTPAASLASTTVTGNATLGLVAVTVNPYVAEQISASEPNVANPGTQSFTVTALPTSAFASQVISAFNDASSELSTLETQINSAASFAADLPFIGANLASDLNLQTLLQPAEKGLNSLETTVAVDLANSGTRLAKLESDIESALSPLGLLAGATPADDIAINYVANGQQGVVSAATTLDLSDVTQLELDLTLGQSTTSAVPLGADIGLPGLGLSLQPGSQVNATIAWSVDVGLGFTATAAYLVAGASANGGEPINFNVGFTLGNGFQAVGTMGFLQALLTEPNETNASAHTGVTGNIGVTISGATGGTALNGGVQINPADIANLTASPDFSLTTQSVLQFSFGADFQRVAGVYSDVSDFPSLSATLAFNWDITGSSLASAGAPEVALNNIQFNIGAALTDLLEPILKPIYDETSGLLPEIDFLTAPVPILDDFLSAASSFGIPDSIIQQWFPSYGGGTYDWLHLGVDALTWDDDITPAENSSLVSATEAVITVVKEIDQVYSEIQSLGPQGLGIDIGSIDFSGKNLALPQVDVTNVAQLSSIGDQLANLSSLDGGQFSQADAGAISNYLTGLDAFSSSGLPFLTQAGGSIGGIGSALSNVVNGVSEASTSDEASPSTSEMSFSSPILQNPSSILGLLFGQNVQFFSLSAAFHIDFSDNITLGTVYIPPIFTVSIGIDLAAELDFGIQANYNSTGLEELAGFSTHSSGETPSEMLLDGVEIGADPMLAGTPYSGELFHATGKFGVAVSGGVGIPPISVVNVSAIGGLGIAFDGALLGVTTKSQFVNLNALNELETASAGNPGYFGPVEISTTGFAYLDLAYWCGIKVDDLFTITFASGEYTIATFQLFHFGGTLSSIDENELAFYNPGTELLTLYVGPLTYLRNDGADWSAPADPSNPADVAQAYSANYTIDVASDNSTTLSYTDPNTNVTTTQNFGPVKLIYAVTGAGNDDLEVVDQGKNSVNVDFVGSSGSASSSTGNSGGPKVGGEPVSGNDIFSAAGGSATLIGGAGDSELIGGGLASTLIGGAGNDTIYGESGGDYIYSDGGNDSIVAATATNPAYTGNNIVLDAGNDTIAGGNGKDTIFGGPGNDSIVGGNGGSLITVGAGNNTILGGSGADTITAGNGDNLVKSGNGADSITVGNGDNTIDGGVGNDTITAGNGSNSIDGGDGDDIIIVGLTGDGANSITGGQATTPSASATATTRSMAATGTIPSPRGAAPIRSTAGSATIRLPRTAAPTS